jgi:2-polyprenyl-3-methyl-5-hydroxy-6-metoxy-1,4-benzoquinol methylase
MENKYDLSWEEIVYEMQNLEAFSDIIRDSYLSMNLEDNCERYYNSPEFGEIMKILNKEKNGGSLKILDLAASNGIASYSLSKNGYEVYAIDQSSSRIVGTAAVEYLRDKFNFNIKVRPFDGKHIGYNDGFFDIVFERQYLHHAFDMEELLGEISRVLKPGGIFIGIRENVVDNHDLALKKFYRTNKIHLTYGHEKAFKYSFYTGNIKKAGLELMYSIGPYESEINIPEGSFIRLKEKIMGNRLAGFFRIIFGEKFVFNFGLLMHKIKYRQGRLFSFIAEKP